MLRSWVVCVKTGGHAKLPTRSGAPAVQHQQQSSKDTPSRAEHFDVILVGAGVSGIGSAHYLKEQCPRKSFVILEREAGLGGTWRSAAYPGIRSDSATYTYAYQFKPWTDQGYPTADVINDYLGEVIAENGLAPHIRYRNEVVNIMWVERREPLEACSPTGRRWR